MSHPAWQTELARRVKADLPDSYRDFMDGSKKYTLELGPLVVAEMGRLRGRVNAEPIAGLSRGRVLVVGFGLKVQVRTLGELYYGTFAVKEWDWNMLPRPDGAMQLVLDAKGHPAYPYADLSAIPDPMPRGTPCPTP